MQARIVFMGTPEFSVPALEALGRLVGDPERLLVVTQPDRPAGRGRRLQPPPVRMVAERLGMDLLQVATMKDPEARERLEAFAPNLIVVAAFGLILPRWVLRLPSHGCVNLHASLLPRFRGASPVAAAIACGDRQSGVVLMEMEAGLDTGGVYALEAVDITTEETTESLTARLAEVGAHVLVSHLDALLRGELTVNPQQGQVVETRKIYKDHGAVDWERDAVELERHVRAMWSWPRAWTVGNGGLRVQIHTADVAAGAGVPGTVIGHDADGVSVACGDGALRLRTVQLAGKQPVPASSLRQHPAFAPGAAFSRGDGFVEPAPWIVDAGLV
jgi:methionyl-tRNA formyltransferase